MDGPGLEYNQKSTMMVFDGDRVFRLDMNIPPFYVACLGAGRKDVWEVVIGKIVTNVEHLKEAA